MESHYKWAAIVFGVGIVLIIWDVMMSKKKKEGFTPTDRGRIVGVFWISVMMSALTGFIVWAA